MQHALDFMLVALKIFNEISIEFNAGCINYFLLNLM